jgi:Tol biopolymer transport system component
LDLSGDTSESPEQVSSNSSDIERFKFEHLGKVVGLSDPRISPDGSSIVVRVSRTNYDENRFDIELIQLDVNTGTKKILTRRNASKPRWSPSGKKLAFLCEVNSKSQLFIMPIDGGEAKQVSDAPMGIEAYSWRPDGKALAYISQEKPVEVEGSERHNKAFEADVNYLLKETPRSHHIWLLPVEGGASKQLTSGEWSVAATRAHAWFPNGKEIAFGWQPGPGPRYLTDISIRILEVETGSIRRLNDIDHRISDTAISPDGKYISYHYPRDGARANES